MIFGVCGDEALPYDEAVLRVLVWNWKTGDLVTLLQFSEHSLLTSPQVLNLSSSDESKLVTRRTQVVFLDEFRMILLPDWSAVTELIVFNTLIPQGRPENLRRLGVPRRFHHQFAKILVDNDRPLGAPNRNEPLIADPAQAVLVLEIISDLNPHTFLVVRMQALVERTRLTSVDSCVPWDEWGADAVVMEVPMRSGPEILIHGAQVAAVWERAYDWGIQTFDFSRRGCNSLPPWADGGSGTERSVLFEGEEGLTIQLGRTMISPENLGSLSDGSLIHLVSCFPQSVCSEATVDVMARGHRMKGVPRALPSTSGSWFESAVAMASCKLVLVCLDHHTYVN